MRSPKSVVLLVALLGFSITLTGCSGLGEIFSGLLSGLMSSFGDLFTAEGFGQFLGSVMGQAASNVGQQVSSGGEVSSSDIWGSIGNAAVSQLGNRAQTGLRRGRQNAQDTYNRQRQRQQQQQQTQTPRPPDSNNGQYYDDWNYPQGNDAANTVYTDDWNYPQDQASTWNSDQDTNSTEGWHYPTSEETADWYQDNYGVDINDNTPQTTAI